MLGLPARGKLSHDDRIFVSPLQVFEPCLFLESFHSCGKYTWACLIFSKLLQENTRTFKQNACMHILSIKTVQEKLKTSKLHGPIKRTGMIRNGWRPDVRSNIHLAAVETTNNPTAVPAFHAPTRGPTTVGIAGAPSCFPHISHVQHPIYF